MKKCPNCKKPSIPINWILFHQMKKNKSHFFECPNCKKSISTGHLINFNFLYSIFTDPLDTPILLIILYILFGLVNTVFIIIFTILGFFLLFLLQQYIVPLELYIETKSGEKGLTRIQAILSFILITFIIVFTVYLLLVKPLILKEPIF